MFTEHQLSLARRRSGPLVAMALMAGFAAERGGALEGEPNHPLGDVAFPISCVDSVHEPFNRALAKLHHMMYVQAENEFRAVADEDQKCAMAYWGIAMTRFHPLWPGQPSLDDLQIGSDAITRAEGLKPSTSRERAYVKAAKVFYKNWQTADHKTRLAKWEQAQNEVKQQHPDDPDAVALHALAQLATAPKGDKTYSRQRVAGRTLEEMHARHPKHPAGFHYLIHAYDNPVLAERAETIARGYSDIAPNVPHALHMPAHIFVRLGLWEDVIEWNRRSARAAAAQPVNGAVSKHYVHAVDYLIYGYLQQSKDQLAREALDEMLKEQRFQPGFVSAYGLAAAQARYSLERERWKEAADLKSRVPQNFDWDKFPAVVAITEFARGIGAARSGNQPIAQDAVDQLDALYTQLIEKEDRYWSVLVDSQRHSVAAWLAFSRDQKQQAIEQMRIAADLEDSVDKHPVTPGSVLPARELLGDMLLTIGLHGEALAAYNSALTVSPNRLRSLHGARLAAGAGRVSASIRTQ